MDLENTYHDPTLLTGADRDSDFESFSDLSRQLRGTRLESPPVEWDAQEDADGEFDLQGGSANPKADQIAKPKRAEEACLGCAKTGRRCQFSYGGKVCDWHRKDRGRPLWDHLCVRQFLFKDLDWSGMEKGLPDSFSGCFTRLDFTPWADFAKEHLDSALNTGKTKTAWRYVTPRSNETFRVTFRLDHNGHTAPSKFCGCGYITIPSLLWLGGILKLADKQFRRLVNRSLPPLSPAAGLKLLKLINYELAMLNAYIEYKDSICGVDKAPEDDVAAAGRYAVLRTLSGYKSILNERLPSPTHSCARVNASCTVCNTPQGRYESSIIKTWRDITNNDNFDNMWSESAFND